MRQGRSFPERSWGGFRLDVFRSKHLEQARHFGVVALVSAARDSSGQGHVELAILQERFVDMDAKAKNRWGIFIQ